MMGGDDDDGDAIAETQETSSENLFHLGGLRAALPRALVCGSSAQPPSGKRAGARAKERAGGRHRGRR